MKEARDLLLVLLRECIILGLGIVVDCRLRGGVKVRFVRAAVNEKMAVVVDGKKIQKPCPELWEGKCKDPHTAVREEPVKLPILLSFLLSWEIVRRKMYRSPYCCLKRTGKDPHTAFIEHMWQLSPKYRDSRRSSDARAHARLPMNTKP